MLVSFLILGILSCSKEDSLSDSENNGWQDDVMFFFTKLGLLLILFLH